MWLIHKTRMYVIDTQNERSVIDTLSEESVIDTLNKWSVIDTLSERRKCDRYTKGEWGVIDTLKKWSVIDTLTEWSVIDTLNKGSQTELLWMNRTYNIVHEWERNLIGTMQYNAWCLRNAINKRSGALESTSWGEWRWTALLRRGSPLVLFEHLPSTYSTKALKYWQGFFT